MGNRAGGVCAPAPPPGDKVDAEPNPMGPTGYPCPGPKAERVWSPGGLVCTELSLNRARRLSKDLATRSDGSGSRGEPVHREPLVRFGRSPRRPRAERWPATAGLLVVAIAVVGMGMLVFPRTTAVAPEESEGTVDPTPAPEPDSALEPPIRTHSVRTYRPPEGVADTPESAWDNYYRSDRCLMTSQLLDSCEPGSGFPELVSSRRSLKIALVDLEMSTGVPLERLTRVNDSASRSYPAHTRDGAAPFAGDDLLLQLGTPSPPGRPR